METLAAESTPKILVVHSSGIQSGGEVISLSIYRGLKDTFNFAFFIPCPLSKAQLSCSAQSFYSKSENFFVVFWHLRRTILHWHPDIVQAHGTRAALFVKLAKLSLGRYHFKFIYTIHGFHLAHKKRLLDRVAFFIEKLTNRLVDIIVCVGQDDYKLVSKTMRGQKPKIILIKNAVMFPYPQTDKNLEQLRQRSKYLVMTICRLHYQKNVATLIEAFQFLDNNFNLVIIGDGPQLDSLQRLTHDLKLSERIFFAGNKPNASSLIHYCDVFCLSTHWEGLPLVLLEAMLSRVPVVASNVHGVREIVRNNVTGWLFETNDAQELSHKIIQAVSNSSVRDNIVEKAHELVLTEYNIGQMIDGYKKLYKSTL